jgi:subtilisin family serine protease
LCTLAALIVLGTHASSQGAGRPRASVGGHEVVDGEVLIRYRDGYALAQHAQIESHAEADESEPVGRRGVRRLHSRRFRTSELLETLKLDPDVEFAEPNYILYAATQPNDPSFTSLWAMLNTGSNPIGGGGVAGADIDATTAWTITTGSRANVVGVVDSGVDYNHPDLFANMWSAPAQFSVVINGQTITCAAGTHGFNAMTKTCDPMDDNNHGTHVSGTIGAVGNNGVGVVGVNWTASIMGLKFLGSSGSGNTADAISAIEFAIQAKAAFAGSAGANVRVLSNSWGGGGYSQALVDAISSANSNDMLFVAAAGNNAQNTDVTPNYPSSYGNSNMVSVASSTSSDHLSSFSNYGATSVHLAAPGSAILSTTPNNTYSTFQGTSMATPHVSGAAALTLAACSATTAQLKALILQNVDLVQAFSGTTTTGGRLNVGRMVQNCAQPRVTSVAIAADNASPQSPNTAITFTATASGGKSPIQYLWSLFDGTSWTNLTGWSATNTFTWTPTVANNNYQIVASARSAWNTGAREAYGSIAYVVQPMATALTLTSDKASPQAAGTAITWTATPTGGQAPYQYRWATFDGTAWTIGGWVTANTFSWTPAVAGANDAVAVQVRSAWNSGTREQTTQVSYVVKPAVSSVALSADNASPQAPNTAITFTASASGGEAPYQYIWTIFNGTTWTNVTNWTTTNTFTWTPTVANSNYQVVASARSAWNSGAREAYGSASYVVQPMATALALVPNKTSPQAAGTAITWTAIPTGGQAPYEYRWATFDGTAWTIGGWVTANTFNWTPAVPGANDAVAVQVRSAWNSGTREQTTQVAYVVKPTVSSIALSASKASPQAPNTAIAWTATAIGGEAPYQYIWTIFDGTTWTNVTGWTTTNTFTWTPTAANGNY